jgi:hypothetical protein
VQLEAALQEATGSAMSQHTTHGPSARSSLSEAPLPATEDANVQEINGSGSISLNESISLFQLPGSLRTLAISQDQVDQGIAATRETLVNNAWRERAYERLADTPVCSHF